MLANDLVMESKKAQKPAEYSTENEPMGRIPDRCRPNSQPGMIPATLECPSRELRTILGFKEGDAGYW
jgi:hypothetical protein